MPAQAFIFQQATIHETGYVLGRGGRRHSDTTRQFTCRPGPAIEE